MAKKLLSLVSALKIPGQLVWGTHFFRKEKLNSNYLCTHPYPSEITWKFCNGSILTLQGTKTLQTCQNLPNLTSIKSMPPLKVLTSSISQSHYTTRPLHANKLQDSTYLKEACTFKTQIRQYGQLWQQKWQEVEGQLRSHSLPPFCSALSSATPGEADGMPHSVPQELTLVVNVFAIARFIFP